MDKERVLEEKVNRLLEMFPVVAVIGPRRRGKSTLVRRLRPDWQCYDLESPDDYQLSDAKGFLELHPGELSVSRPSRSIWISFTRPSCGAIYPLTPATA